MFWTVSMMNVLVGVAQATSGSDLKEIVFYDKCNKSQYKGEACLDIRGQRIIACCDYKFFQVHVKEQWPNASGTLSSEGSPWTAIGKFELPTGRDSIVMNESLAQMGVGYICSACASYVENYAHCEKLYAEEPSIVGVSELNNMLNMGADFEKKVVFKIKRTEAKDDDVDEWLDNIKRNITRCYYVVPILEVLPNRRFLLFRATPKDPAKQSILDRYFVVELDLVGLDHNRFYDEKYHRTYRMVQWHGKCKPGSLGFESFGFEYAPLTVLRVRVPAEVKWVNARRIEYTDFAKKNYKATLCSILCYENYLDDKKAIVMQQKLMEMRKKEIFAETPEGRLAEKERLKKEKEAIAFMQAMRETLLEFRANNRTMPKEKCSLQ